MDGIDFIGVAWAILAASPVTAWGMWVYRPRHHAEVE
jgi:hypothetical protein